MRGASYISYSQLVSGIPVVDNIAQLLQVLNELELLVDYHKIEKASLPPDIQGWGHEDPIFDYVIRHWCPRLIIEVGTWKGASAIKMAEIQKGYGIDGIILCIDTWLGSNESLWRAPEVRQSLRLENGYPQMFWQFVANVVASGHVGRIRHLPMTSSAAAQLLSGYGVIADAIYIDAGHNELEVYSDLLSYWPLLKPGGIFFGDDYSDSWPGTVKAVNRFAAETGFKLMGTDWKWLFRKPVDPV